jgi:nucleoside-diphosphate-sugar epimerase
LRVQCVHAADVADAYTRAVCSDVRGAFNVAYEPVLDPHTARAGAARPGGSRPVGGAELGRGRDLDGQAATHGPGWIWLAMRCPLLDSSRARTELGWTPQVRLAETR